jgi:hypothetical protein
VPDIVADDLSEANRSSPRVSYTRAVSLLLWENASTSLNLVAWFENHPALGDPVGANNEGPPGTTENSPLMPLVADELYPWNFARLTTPLTSVPSASTFGKPTA